MIGGGFLNIANRKLTYVDVIATSHLSVRLTAMRVTVDGVSINLCKISTLIIVKTYLQTGEVLPHCETSGSTLQNLLKLPKASVTSKNAFVLRLTHK